MKQISVKETAWSVYGINVKRIACSVERISVIKDCLQC